MAEHVLSRDQIDRLNHEFETAPAERMMQWAVDAFGDDLIVASSFGADSAVMLHLAVTAKPDIRIVTVDTGFLFPETIAFRQALASALGLNLLIYRPRIDREAFLAEHGKMWRVNPDACCGFNKREPFARALDELKPRAWITGIRREQAGTRSQTPIVQIDPHNRVKLCPIALWTGRDVHDYLRKHDLPYHPLRAEGYLSIGCHPEEDYCTSKVTPGEDPRSGRWSAFDKTECGLHYHEQGDGI